MACHYEKGALRAAVLVRAFGRTRDDGGRFIAGDCGAHPWAPPLRAGAEGPAIRLSGFAPVESVEPGVASITPSLRQTNKKAAPWGGFFIDLAERGGSDRPEPNLLTLQQIANRTSVLCCVP